jgi:signal transduction histidine kinase
LEKVYQSNERLIRLVNDLLNVSRIESGTLMTDFQKTSIEKMISSIIDELKIKADERKLYLSWQTPSASSGHILPEIMADTDKLRQVIMNIIDNAIKYTEKGGITVKAESKETTPQYPNGSILIEIRDTGEGMEKDEMDNMFGSFTRGRAGAKHWVSGLGLGLYIAKKFTELHGGKIWVESEGEGKGSTFYIELPVK